MKNKNIRKLNVIFAALVITVASFSYPLMTFSKSQEELQSELADVEKQIAEQEKQLAGIQGERQTIQNKLNELKLSQNNLKLQIKSTSLKINQLDQEIDHTKGSIEGTIKRLEDLKPQIAGLVREMHDKEKQSLVMLFFSQDSLSSALDEIGQMEKISQDLSDLSNEMRKLKTNLEGQQVTLEDQHEDAKNLLNIQALQESEFQVKVQEQNYVLSLTKQQEAEYQQILNQTRARASEIRARLYDLAGGGSREVTFGEAVEIAKYASQLTGVRPALLLAVLTQESNLGKNVGTCNRAGDPPEKGYRQIMHPTRDTPKFFTPPHCKNR